MPNRTDRIEEVGLLHAPVERVWRAVSEAKQFGEWFGVDLDGPFVTGTRVTGRMRPTKVDEEVAKQQAPYAGMPFECTVEGIEPIRRFAFRWHPFAVERDVDYSSEPTTLVAFELEEAPGGTRLTISESGFDQLAPERRAKAREANAAGWAKQMSLVEKYVTGDGAAARAA